MEQTDRRERVFGYVLMALAVLMFFSLNLLTRVMRDDYSYTFNFVTKERIDSFADIFQSLGIHYTHVNGRLPVHFFAHFFLWMGKGVFNVANTAAFAGLVTLVYYHAYGTLRRFRPYAWLAMFAGLWVLTPAFGESFLWVTGASNYLYGMLMILLYLIPYRRLPDAERPTGKPWYVPLALLGGVLAGWTNESTGGALAVVLVCLIAWRLIEKKPLPLWCWAGLLGCVAGLFIMVLAPGELNRLNSAGGMGGLGTILRRAIFITAKLLRYLWPGILAWLLLFAYFLRRRCDIKRLIYPVIFLLAGCAAAYAMAFSPQMPDRIWSGPIVYFLISLLALYRAADEPRIRNPRLRVGAVTLCAALVLASYAYFAPIVARTAEAMDARLADAAAQLASGQRDLTLDAIYGSGVSFDAAEVPYDITPDPTHWLNSALARYVGADTVTAR